MPLTLDAHPTLDAARPFADEPPTEAMRRTVRNDFVVNGASVVAVSSPR